MADEVHSIQRLTDTETNTWTLIVGTNRAGTGVLWHGKTTFTSVDEGFGANPFSMLAWYPFLDNATWVYVSDDTQSRRINVTGTDVKIGIPRPNRHGTNSEYVSIITPAITAVTPTTIYDNSDGSSDTQARADWYSSNTDYALVNATQETINAQKLTQVTEGGAGVDTVIITLQTPAVADTTQTAMAVHKFGSTLDLKTSFSDNSRVEAFMKLSNLQSINFVRIAFTMEVQKTGFGFADNGGLVNITGLTAHGYASGDAVGLTGVTLNGADANGYFFIDVVDANTITLRNSTWAATPTGGSIVNFSKNAFFADITPAMLSIASNLSEDLLTSSQQAASDTDRLHTEYEAYKNFLRPLNMKSTKQILTKWAENETAGFEDFLDNYQGDLSANIANDEWFVFSRPKTSFFRSGNNSTLNWSTITGMAIGAQYNDQASGAVFPKGDRIRFAEITMVTSDSELNSKLGGAPYDWRYTYYESTTGTESNASPIMPEGIDVVHQIVTITMTGIATTIADKLRLYRRGGVSANWHLVDTLANPGVTTTTYVDGKSDLDVLSNRILSTDNYPPLPLPVEVTQLLKFSERFTDSTWAKTNATVKANVTQSPSRAETADLLTATSADGSIVQTITNPGKTTYLSFYVKAKSITGAGPHVSFTNSVDSDLDVTLATPNYDRDEGALGVWERFVMTCSTGITTVGMKLVNNGDEVYIWGAQLDDWDATSGFLAPARHVADLHDESALETQSTRQIIAGGINIDSGLTASELSNFKGSAAVDDTTNILTEILEDGGPPQIWWGPWQGTTIFGIRGYKNSNLVDAGSVYWCKPGQPDHWSPFNRLPVTHSGEPLQNGFLYNTHSYVFSTDNLYRIDPDPTGRGQFVSWPTPVGRGLFFRWGLAVGPKIWFVAKDGIYETTGGPARSITTASFIRPLFEGQTLNGISGVDLANADQDEMRLEFKSPYLYFFFKDLAGNRRVLRWHHEFERWEYYSYADPVRMGYGEEGEDRRLLFGTEDGFILHSGGTFNDHGTAIAGSFRTGALDQGQPGKQKVYGDIHIEALIPTGVTVVVTAHLDDEETAETTQNLVGDDTRTRYKLTLGKDKLARSISLNFAGLESTASVSCAIHEIGIAYQIDQEAELQWDSYFEDDGSMEDKWITGLYLEADTGNVNKTIAVFVDGVEITSQGSPFTINTSEMKPAKISFTSPVRGTHMRFTSVAVAGKLRDWRWIWEAQPVVLTEPFAWDNLGSNHEKYVKGFSIDADTLNQAVTLQLRTNGDETTNALGSDTFVFTHNGRQQSQFAFDDSGANQVLAEVVRLQQTSTNPLQVFNLTWIFDIEPPHKKRWNTQERSFNLPGWGHLRDGYIAIRSAADVTLTVTIDGNAQSGITLSSTSGARRKLYVQYPAFKGKVFRFVLTSASDFKIYNEDTNIWVKPWNSSVGYKQFQLPFEGGTTNP